MKINIRIRLAAAALAATLVFSACTIAGMTADDGELTAESPGQSPAGLANPAAVYCEGLGFITETVTRDGGQDTDCIFPDGERCAAWDFLAGRCGQAYTYCAQHNGVIEAVANIGVCHFPDGSYCDEYLYFSGQCAMGDQPAEAPAMDALEISGFAAARDAVAEFLLATYQVDHPTPWMEENITPDNAAGFTTFRYVSGPLTIVITAEAGAPAPSAYTVDQATDITNGFYWTGRLAADGTIEETQVVLPATVLDAAQAREAALEYLAAAHAVAVSGDWADAGAAPTAGDSVAHTFTTGAWTATVEFLPAAPLVSEYGVVVENAAEGLRWQGRVTAWGEITETGFSQ